MMKKDSQELVEKYEKCQRFSRTIRQPPEDLSSIFAPWSFVQWGIDILGPFPTFIYQKKFVIVVIEYFTKWPEAELSRLLHKKVFNTPMGKHHV